MRKNFTRLFLLIVLLLGSTGLLKAQLLLNEDFTFTGLLTANGWTAHSAAGTNPLSTTTGLSYAGLAGSGVGNAASVGNAGGEDANRQFADQTINGQSVYFSTLVNITDAATAKTGDYFMHIGNGSGASFTSFAARVFVKITGSVVNFGISNTSTPNYGATAFAKNTTYLLIVKYTINTAGADGLSMWIKPAGVPASEAAAGTPEVTDATTTGQDIINSFAFRQGSSANSVEVAVDAIKIGTTWASVTSGVAASPQLTVSGTLNDFGNVFIGANSASQSYSLSGANLTGAPGNITVSAPSADFQVSNNNTTWGATASIGYTSATLPATAVYVRFSPQSSGPISGVVSNSGGGVTSAVTVPVSGTGVVPATPVLSASSLAPFGNVCINTVAGPNSFTISGANLSTADITVAALPGFSYATTANGTYTNTLTLSQAGGTFSQAVFVKFSPLAVQSYNGNIVLTGGGATPVNVAASGAGINGAPVVATGGPSAVTINSATLAGSISSTGCTAISAYGIQYSLTSGFSTGTVVASGNLNAGAFTANVTGLSPATTYYYKAFATNGAGTSFGAEQSFRTANPVLTATPLTAFGAICINTTAGPNNFTISSTGLNSNNVTVGPLTGYSFATSATGTYTASLTLTQPGGPFSQIVFVKFAPLLIQSYNGNVPVAGGGASTIFVPVSASGVNAVPTVVTGTSSGITPNAAQLAGSLAANGCSNATAYGIEYSSISGFANGNGIKVPAQSITGSNFSSNLTRLVQNTTYYYKAYATNNGGTAYGAEATFTTPAIPAGLVIYGTPIRRGGNMHYTLKGITPGHYAAKIFNVNGQGVFRRDMILQVDFIDDNFTIPSNIGTGLYNLEIEALGFKSRKMFMIW